MTHCLLPLIFFFFFFSLHEFFSSFFSSQTTNLYYDSTPSQPSLSTDLFLLIQINKKIWNPRTFAADLHESKTKKKKKWRGLFNYYTNQRSGLWLWFFSQLIPQVFTFSKFFFFMISLISSFHLLIWVFWVSFPLNF